MYRTAHQFHTDLEFGAELRILFAFFKVVGRGGGLEQLTKTENCVILPVTDHGRLTV